MADKTSIIIAVLLLTILSNGMTPNLVEESSMSLVQQGYVRAVGGELTYLNMNLSVPSNTDYQTSVTDMPVTKADAVNSIVNIVSDKPGNPFNYKVTSSVSLKQRHTTQLPDAYQIGYAQMVYTKATQRIQSDDAEISGLARSITANSSDDFEKISKLAVWVNELITYDSSLAGQLKDAKWVLQNKRGVCTEYATLFVALARSIGIPARIVNGVAYDDSKNEWAGHSWAEAYIGAWVPVDPTWGPPEVGYLDATHLEVSKVIDNETFENVFTYTSQSARLEWSRPNPQDLGEITLLSFKEGEKNADYNLQDAADAIGFGMKTMVFATISSDEYRVASLNLSPCTSDFGNIINVEDGEKSVVLEPHQTKVVSWVIYPTSGLASNSEYTCPLIINSDYFSAKELDVRVTSSAETIGFNGFAEKGELQLGENQTIYVDVGVSRTYSGNLYLTSQDSVYSQPIRRSGRYSFQLHPASLGLNRVYLATSLGGAKELDFYVTESIGMGVDVNAPQYISLGSEGKIYVNLTSNESGKTVRITASAGAYKEARQIILIGNKTLEFSIKFDDSKVQNVTIDVESGGFIRELVEPVTVYAVPTINFTKSLSNLGNGSMRVDLVFSGIGDIKDAELSVDGMQVALRKGAASLVLAPGVHKLRLNYSDMGGTKHSYNADFDVQVTYIGINESSIQVYVSDAAKVLPIAFYFGSILVLVAAVLALKKTKKKEKTG
jgi:transglutaminase-like putative cysteine protease